MYYRQDPFLSCAAQYAGQDPSTVGQLRTASRIVHAETLTDLRREQAKQAGLIRPSNHFGRYSQITNLPRISTNLNNPTA